MEYIKVGRRFVGLERDLEYANDQKCGQVPSSPPCILVKHRFILVENAIISSNETS